MLTYKEIQDNLDVMKLLSVPQIEQDYFVESANDTVNADIIDLVHGLSSAAWWMAASRGSDEMSIYARKHVEARRKLIEKIKELRNAKRA